VKKFVTFLLLAAVGTAGYFVWQRQQPPAQVAKVIRGAVSFGPVTETVQAQGYLEPLKRVNVGSQVSGVVKELYADYNSIVKEGQLLAELDSAQLEVQVAIQQASVDRMFTDIANQEMQLADVRRQFERTAQLHDRGLQTQQQFEAAELALKNRQTQVAAVKKQLVQAEANLSAAKMNLSYAKIYSPIDGVVIQRRVSLGQTVQASVTSPQFFLLCTPLQTLKLTAWVDEASIGRVRPGQQVGFQVGTYGSEIFPGTVDAIRLNAQTVNNIVTYPVWISVPNDALRLRPGMTAQVYMYVSSAQEVVRIPNEALRFRPTRAAYLALGGVPPKEDAQRAIEHQGDKVVDPTVLRAREPEGEAQTIDQLFAPLPVADSRATVWIWDETEKQFVSKTIRVGVSDGNMTALLSGDVHAGDELVTGVILPMPLNAPTAANPLLGGPRNGR
jgi:HlyD family secretion protein